MHYEGHCRCSECFAIASFKKIVGPLQYLHCTAQETGNSLLATIRKSAFRMRQENLMEVIRLKLEIQNRQRILTLLKARQCTADIIPEFDPVAFVENLL
jgi:hypothetical protein